MSNRHPKFYTILNAKGATGIGNVIDVRDCQQITVAYATSGTTTATVKFAGANKEASPTFSSAQSATNIWDYVAVLDLNSGSAITGDTGIALSGSDDVRLLEINTTSLSYITIIVTAWTQGALYAYAMITENV